MTRNDRALFEVKFLNCNFDLIFLKKRYFANQAYLLRPSTWTLLTLHDLHAKLQMWDNWDFEVNKIVSDVR